MMSPRTFMREGWAPYHLFDFSHTGEIQALILPENSFLHGGLTRRLHCLASLDGLPGLHHVLPPGLGLANAETETEVLP